ncbi:hypothetical protein ACDQ55_05330 [Chitinophaga sp. 30R24]|uniref:hypothetical protein n=1 Tax=Chitinophaga sp. 30R24 TaxID=3248838 RepID=UPI003B8F2B74
MKRTLLINILIILSISVVNGQDLQTVTTYGNTTNNALFINGAEKYNIGNYNGLMLYFYNGAGYVDAFNPSSANFLPLLLRGSSIQTNNKLLINNATDDGSAALQVNGNTTFTATLANIKRGAKFMFDDADNGRSVLVMDANGGDFVGSDYFYIEHNGGQKGARLTTANNAPIKFATAETERMVIDENGRVGIGISNPQSELAVAGTITSKRVKVTASGWPDYVFHKDYKLPSLLETEAYIAINSHLPGIPAAKEIERDGLDIAEINKQLLQKIEELTLHLINQQKEIEELKDWKKKLETK